MEIGNESPAVVYGNDSRREVATINNKTIEILSQISVALVEKTSLKKASDGSVEILGQSLSEKGNFCPTEPFIKQRAGAFCSGVLFRGKYVLTAGHCLSEADSCAKAAFVFGYKLPKGSENWNYRVPAKNVFTCKRIVAKHYLGVVGGGTTDSQLRTDFAIVELDRQVANQGAIAVNQTNIAVRSPVFVLGYPTGLPQKYADGIVTENQVNANYFKTQMDTYGGNSGSPVFNANGVLEGLLIQGHQDYARTPAGCIASVKCLTGGNNCLGERVIKAEQIRKFLKINSF